MLAGESRVGLVPCACWDNHATLSLKKCGFLIILTSFLLGGGLLIPYITVMVRNTMPAFLPFISDAGGYPPSNGVFSIFMVLGSLIGAVTFPLLYASINHRNVENSKLITICNKLAILFILAGGIGLVITVNNPVGYHDVPNKFEWVTTVLYQHAFGATLVLVGLAIYQFFLAVVWWSLPDTSKLEKNVNLLIVILYIVISLITAYPMVAFTLELLGPNPFDFSSMKKQSIQLPPEFTVNYKICAFCEWGLVILSVVNIMTHFKDLQKVSLHLVLRHKSCLQEAIEPVPSISLNIIK